MDKVRLVMQNNLISENDLGQMQAACKEANIECQEIIVTPFSDEIPEFLYSSNNFYYGSTTLMNNLYRAFKPKGLFYDNKIFTMSNYFDKWGNYMLNYGAVVSTIGEFLDGNAEYIEGRDIRFVRPDGDGKEFDGQVGTISELKEMLKRSIKYESPLTRETRIVVGTAYNIRKEWRLYIVGGEIITASRYRKDFKLSKSGTDIPETMLEFARDRISEFKPHENFAIDIAQMDDGSYYIIECGCLNSVGFYHCDINKLIKSIIKWMKN